MPIGLKRAYEPPAEDDGHRILIDRFWPRGITKAELRIDAWRKDLAPSDALRTWFGHDPAKWDAFRQLYAEELAQHGDALDALAETAQADHLTLLFGARDMRHNHAVALKEQLERRLRR